MKLKRTAIALTLMCILAAAVLVKPLLLPDRAVLPMGNFGASANQAASVVREARSGIALPKFFQKIKLGKPKTDIARPEERNIAKAFAAEDEAAKSPVIAKYSKSAVSMDFASGMVAYEKNPNERLPIASMVKLMTTLLVFESIERGEIGLEEMIVVSQNAASMGGSQAFLDANQEYKAEELVKSIIVASANDSCVALAERIAGSVEGFVDLMNARAAELGMTDTNYVNCTGLPAPNAYSSALDTAKVTRELLRHERFFEYAQIWMFDFVHPSGRITGLTNTNKLIKAYQGCDGGKTGFTQDAMHCLSSTAMRNGMRAIAVVIGAPDSKVRFFENSELLNDMFGNYEVRTAVFGGEQFGDIIPVPNSKEKELRITAREDLTHFDRKRAGKDLTTEVTINAVSAPLRAGDIVGRVVLKADGTEVAATDLLAMNDISKLGFFDIVDDFVKKWN